MVLPRRQSALVLMLIASFTLLFSPGLFWHQVPAFRDAFHFYYPQVAWLSACVDQGEFFPTWNRFDGLGSSVTGQVSTAIFYPLRVLWHLPWLSIPQRFSLFIVAHLGIAALGIFLAARRMQLGVEPSILAATAYSLSCPVFFQHNNLIYLTSAAWVGFVIFSVAVRPRRFWLSAVVCGAALSMMVLGGDPHTAINSVIVLAAISLIMLVQSWRSGGEGLLQHGVWITAVCTLCVCATAIQWIPAIRWAKHSSRVLQSRSQAETGSADITTLSSEQQHLVRQLDMMEVTANHNFEFSLSPLHLSTLAWPTLGGHYAPQNSRWFAAIPSEGRMWLPSLYFGILPLQLLLGGFRRSRTPGTSDRISPSLVWIAVLALLASLGNYSIVWLARELFISTGYTELANQLPADSVGSLYGALMEVIPGYESFRYPAKWTVWFVAPSVLLAARGLESSYTCDDSRPLRDANSKENLATAASSSFTVRWLKKTYFWCSVSIVIVGGLICCTPLGEWLIQQQPNDAWLGQASQIPSGKTIIIAGLVPLFVYSIRTWLAKLSTTGLVALTIVEMTIVAANWIAFTEAPSPATLSAFTSREPLVWDNIARADIRKHTNPNETSLVRQTSLQEHFQLGKLSSLVGARNLAAIQSIDAMPVEKLRGYLFALDDLTENQRELDQTLGIIGVSQRLYFDSDKSLLRWKSIPDAKPLCSLVGIPPNTRVGEVENFEWLSPDELEIRIHAVEDCTLVIRQFDDGGWKYSSQSASKPDTQNDHPLSYRLLQRDKATPFIELPVSAGRQTIHVCRRWFW